MMREDPLISVIVPCYKVEKYLPSCIESILRQTYGHIEVIIVDDGSPDKCGLICDDYAERDSRIRVIHKNNGGLSDARNVGIDQARGEWITYIDGDDYVSDSYVETLYTLAKDYGCDCSVCCFRSFKEGGKNVISQTSPHKEMFSPMEALKQMFYQKAFDHNAHSKLYHRRLFESGIRYPLGMVFEDLATTYKLLIQSNGVAYTDEQLYYYLLRADSIEGTYTTQKVEDALTILKLVDEQVDIFKDILKAYQCRKFSFLLHLFLAMPVKANHYDEIKYSIINLRRTVLLDSHARKKARAAAFLSYLGFGVLKCVFPLINKRRRV